MDKENKPVVLGSGAIQIFLATLAGLTLEERLKAKELYIRNAISEYHSEIRKYKNNYFLLAIFYLVPFFWPMLFGSQRASKIELEETKKRIENALSVWKEELGSKYQELLDLLQSH